MLGVVLMFMLFYLLRNTNKKRRTMRVIAQFYNLSAGHGIQLRLR
jgi:hypothetical protein